ncbi:MAG TPA: flagellar assembly peptidoglycan hydrolase FlgJ [Burkholderiaceae bacterium]|nr:flagellar assembly peptidoglycan hydrolase FlgJ [Burkholderiaceae bacterium]
MTPTSLLGSSTLLNPAALGQQVTSQVQGLAADGASLNNLKLKAGQDSKAALKEAAKQFESLFMREIIKSMRQATAKSGLMDDSAGENLATDMLDQQMAVHMTGLPGGLSEAIERQLARQMDPNSNGLAAKVSSAYQRAAGAESLARASMPAVGRITETQTAFVNKLSQAANRVAAEVGIPSAYMLGQAGHETGWGRSEIKNADGSNSFNLFGIKATGGWTGKVAEITTTEYIDGEPRKVVAKFRAYDSYEESFRDYARLVGSSPRYQAAMQNLGSAQAFATQLQKAGYATDPQYAAKLSRAINTTLSLQRVYQA